jgi:hypothetical protein
MTVFVPTFDKNVIRKLFTSYSIYHNKFVYCTKATYGYRCSDKEDPNMWCHSEDFLIVELAKKE